ncbi:NAD(P)/FAD-dependent oxidoreductase [Pseudodesulfovibrio cashew]|uniref:NAD(P)/FAD-dependent oxidoreductase n=1 Tax=Pseudodesulfovibrio cashew TaxID=2678688 RepID=A0A6I6JCE5_9BACT|nr:NAD(P)/FAD-dependent oxidoreductase [Pseudodesulfovibrio cashew]QGY38720.1 NAD(P)/FAD-dependent oxidoreductase [Pseudodesulfovibrio cashew]
MYTHDVIVLGGGPAGGGVAAILARAGKNVAMTESVAYGGVCPLRGCNPKKVLLSGAEAVHMAKGLAGKGVRGALAVDWAELMEFKRSFSDPVPESARKAYADMGIDVRLGEASFTGPETVSVNGETLSAPHICICVGQTPNTLDAPGCEDLPVSDDFLELEALPRRVVFIGGGFIAFEFAHVARQAGAEVVLLNRSDRVLRKFDPVLADELVKASVADGIDVRMEHPIHRVEKTGKGYVVHCGEGGGDRVEADMVFNCTGRRPALDGLELEAAGVEFSRHGVTVDEGMRSVSNPSVFALGDVADQGAALTPVATIQSQVAAANILEPGSATVNYSGVPNVCYTVPPLAGVGLLETEAAALGLDFEVKETNLADSFPWQRLGEKAGRARVLVSEKEDRILGAHLLGHNCEEVVNLFALIIRQEIPLSKVRDTVWAYPTCGYYLKYMV